MVRIEVLDSGRAKELIRVLVTRMGAEPVSLDSGTGEVCVEDPLNEDGLARMLGAVDEWLEDSDVAVIKVASSGRSFTVGAPMS